MNRSIQNLAGISLLALAAMFGGNVASAADANHEVRSVNAPFDSLKIDGPIDVRVVQGANASVVIDAPASLASGVHTSVQDGTLNIDSSGLHLLQFGTFQVTHAMVTVTVTTLKKITVDGSGDLYASHLASSDELVLKLRGSGDATLEEIKVGKLTAEISGSADVEASGSALQQSVKIAGSGDYNGANLKGDSVAVAIAGSGDAAVWAVKSLAIQIAGSGDVGYWGDPAVSQSVLGSGDVSHLGSKS